MHKVVIVIPMYKSESDLKASEKASLVQAKEIFGHYDICFVAPEKLRDIIGNDEIRAEFWPNSCFGNVRTYSRLLLTEEFYTRFSDYEYMLLYQLDAFVFSDRLQEFCDMNYDYIGAPMPRWSGWGNMRIGNGGFSLRKIKSCIQVVRRKNEIYKKTGRGEECEWAEDKFFGICGYDNDISFSVPDIKTALKFAIEYDVMNSYNNISKDNLPFGCHAWPKTQYWIIWEPLLKEFIPNWDDVKKSELTLQQGNTYRETRYRALMLFLLKRFCNHFEPILHDSWIEHVIPNSKEYMLWGSGKIGQETLALMNMFSRSVRYIVDRNTNVKELNKIKVLSPQDALSEMKNVRIIVSVLKEKYVNEIINYLNKIGLIRNRDYILYIDLVNAVIESYWKKSIHKWGR